MRGPVSMTDAGYPVPLCGKPITKTPVVAADPNSDKLRSYPKYFIPEQEELADNEMRLTAVGSGNPTHEGLNGHSDAADGLTF